jgi:hypothetical protein
MMSEKSGQWGSGQVSGPRTEWRTTMPPARGKSYCTNKSHGYGEHDASCCPPADPRDPELRLIRAIFGLCSLCDVTDPHSHVPEDRP